jgi:glutamine amidotransferase
MCVICFKPVGVRLPPTWALEESNRNNPHGAGFAVAEPDRARIIIKKGFRSALALEEALVKTIREMGRTQLGVQAVIHFRYATHGTKSGGNCHPFPLSRIDRELKATTIICKTAIVHNGTFPVSVPPTLDDFSDTQYVIKEYFSKYSFGGLLKAREELKEFCGFNKVIIMNHDQRFIRIGDFQLYRGCYWSNKTFLPKSGRRFGKRVVWSCAV